MNVPYTGVGQTTTDTDSGSINRNWKINPKINIFNEWVRKQTSPIVINLLPTGKDGKGPRRTNQGGRRLQNLRRERGPRNPSDEDSKEVNILPASSRSD